MRGPVAGAPVRSRQDAGASGTPLDSAARLPYNAEVAWYPLPGGNERVEIGEGRT